MPPHARAIAGLSGLVDSDSEADFEQIKIRPGAASTSNRSVAASKSSRGRPAGANRVAKPQPKPTRRTSDVVSISRQALSDKSNTNKMRAPKRPAQRKTDIDDFEAGDHSDIREEEPVKILRVKHTKPTSSIIGKITERAAAIKTSEQPDNEPASQEVEAMDIDENSREGSEHVEHHSDSERMRMAEDYDDSIMGHDATSSLRRRLGDLTRKYEGLEARHRDLREVGVKDAERIYDRLRKQNEDNTNASNKLIAQLREEIAAQSGLAEEGEDLRRQLSHSEEKVDSLQDKMAELTRSLAEARSEVKNLSNKLAAARSTEAASKVPGSAMKNGAAHNRASPSEAVLAAQAKEDLYGDLTGLIVRSLKRADKEDVFDCIQTGRNGTLHFNLTVDNAEAAGSYEDVQFTYRPQLDPDRDGDLMDVLPDYLVEEITFLRPQASKFYSRVIKCLTERLE